MLRLPELVDSFWISVGFPGSELKKYRMELSSGPTNPLIKLSLGPSEAQVF